MKNIEIKKRDTKKPQPSNNKEGKSNAKDKTAPSKMKQTKNEEHNTQKGRTEHETLCDRDIQNQRADVQNKVQPNQKGKANASPKKQKHYFEDSDSSSEEISSDDVSMESIDEFESNNSGYKISIPLYVTAAIDSPEKMQHYFEKDPSTGQSLHDPNGRCLNDGSTPLHLAIRAKQLDVVKLLLQSGADLALCDSAGDNILMRAIRSTDANMINTVWPYRRDLNINHTNTDGMSALHLSAEQKWECCLNFLLQNKADPNIQNTRTGVTPLMIAAANGDTKIAENLIRAGAEILVEDYEGFTCIYKSFENKHTDMMTYLLKHLSEDDKELFIKARLDYVFTPPIIDEEKTFIVDMYFPLLAECTNHKELKPSLYNQKAIHRIALKIEEYIQSVDIVISGSHLLFCIMFKFGDPIDFKFLRQYLNCKGPDLTIEVTKYYTEVWKMTERSIIAVFLPMIGLAVIPEGRSWIKKHYLSVSEYINFFKKENLKQYIAPHTEFAWCLTKGQFGKIYKVWNRFYDVVNEIQTEQRVKNMNELLEEEEKEKERQVKKKEKKKQKRQDKLKKSDEKLCCEADLLIEEANIAVSNTFCTNENAQRENDERKDMPLLQNATNNSKLSPNVYMVESEFTPFCNQWTTVQTKKNTNKDKTNLGKSTSDQLCTNVAEKSLGNKGKRRRKPAIKVQHIPTPQPPVPIPNCSGKARWADIAKVKPKLPDSKDETHAKIAQIDSHDKPKPVAFVASDFPSLSGKSPVKNTDSVKKSDKTGMFTFYFHDECNATNTEPAHQSQYSHYDGNQAILTDITFLGEPVDGSDISGGGVIEKLDQNTNDWTWEKVAEIGEYGRGTHSDSRTSQTDRVMLSSECNDHLYTDPNDLPTDEVFIDDNHDTKTEHSIIDSNIHSAEVTEHLNTPVVASPFSPRKMDAFEYGYAHDMPCPGDQQDCEERELYFEPDDTQTVPKWVEELEEFDDESCTNNDTPDEAVIGDFLQGSIPSDTDRVDVTEGQDLVNTDPAIIGCGGLHKPHNRIPQSDQQENVAPAGRQLQSSRFLGNVIKTESEKTYNQSESNSCRGHKGWSNKRRMKNKACPPLSTNNWTFGGKLLETAQQLERELPMQGICYPESLRGDKENEVTHFFPSFHENTKLSAQIDPRNFSFVHRVQLMQLADRQDYIDKSIKSTQDESLFAYYASCAGLSQQQYYQLMDKIRNQNKTKPRNPLEQLLEKQQNQYQNTHQVSGETKPTWNHDVFKDKDTFTNMPNVQVETTVTNDIETAATNLYNYQSYAMGCKQFENETKSAIVNPETVGIPVPTPAPEVPVIPPNQANVYAIQTAQSAMQKDLMNQIREMYRGILKDKIKSVRWRENLWNMRHIPVERQMIISKMVIPADERDRCYISLSSSDSTVLGFLTDGTEVAVKIVDGQSREFTQNDLQYLVDMDVSKYFMAKYRDYCFHDGVYYIALDLYEYSLTDYLVKLKRGRAGRDQTTTYGKLIWQLMRGLESLHQNCLIVHGELRPDNVVIDTDGNVRIAGYGLGRNAGRDGPFLDYTDEEKCWLTPEVLVHKQKVSFKSDIWVAGMLMYYILSGGKNPFGADVPNIIWNIGNQGYAMDYINEEAGHLMCLMLSINKSERPCISEAIKHPYFWGQEKQLRFILIAGSDVLRDVKAGVPMSGAVKDSMITIIGTSLCHLKLVNWMPEVEPIVIREMKSFRQYKNNVVELVLFVYNCCTHFETLSETVREIIEEPCKYFLTKFPTLFMTVYRAIRKSSRAERTCYKAFF